MEVFALNAAEYNTTGDRRVGERTFVVISSVTGTTEEMCAAVEKLHAAGARVLGFIDKEDSPWPGRWTGASASPTTSS